MTVHGCARYPAPFPPVTGTGSAVPAGRAALRLVRLGQ
jgi:hypothetical protein